MAERELLHAGMFNDKNGDIIRVSFYRRVDINAYPETLWIDAAGGVLQLVVWSKDGDACLGDPSVEWWNFHQTGAEKIIGTEWYRYYYDIEVDANPGFARETELSIYNDAGEIAHMTVPLRQAGQN